MRQTSVNAISKSAVRFVEQSLTKQVEFSEWNEKAQDQVNDGLKGAQQFENERTERADNLTHELTEKRDELLEKVEVMEKEQKKKIEKQDEPINQDILAEITMLESLDELDNKTLNKYIEKYQHHSLALRKLEEIATSNGIIVNEPLDPLDTLGELTRELNRAIDRAGTPKFINLTPTHLHKETIVLKGNLNDIPARASRYLDSLKGETIQMA